MARIPRIRTKKVPLAKIQIRPSKNTAKLIEQMKGTWQRRAEEAQHYFLLDVAYFLLREVQDRAPEILIGGENVDYAKELRIGILEDSGDVDHLAIYLDKRSAQITQEVAGSMVLYFKAHSSSPEWVDVLIKHGPWPATMIPMQVLPAQARIISRRAREDEIAAIAARLMAKGADIEQELSVAGATGAQVKLSEHGIGLTVNVDIGYDVLRRELGMDGKRDSHWRPAFRATRAYARARGVAKVIDYIQNGNKNIFDLPEETDRIGTSTIEDGRGFAKEIAPFVG